MSEILGEVGNMAKILLAKKGDISISLSNDEVVVLVNALNEICYNTKMDDGEFQTRIGLSRDFAERLLSEISEIHDRRA